MRNLNAKPAAYTLIEVLVVVAIIATAGAIVVEIFSSDNSAAWKFTVATGQIWAVVPAAKMTELNISTNDAIAE